jgi:hypothetical protein
LYLSRLNSSGAAINKKDFQVEREEATVGGAGQDK